MNKNQVKGAAKDVMGKVQESTGKLIGNRQQQAKGLGKQAAGKMQKVIGDIAETARNASKKQH